MRPIGAICYEMRFMLVRAGPDMAGSRTNRTNPVNDPGALSLAWGLMCCARMRSPSGVTLCYGVLIAGYAEVMSSLSNASTELPEVDERLVEPDTGFEIDDGKLVRVP